VWNIVRAALIDGLDHPGVGLGPNRVVAGLMELESYERRGDSYKDDEQLDEELYDIGADLGNLRAGARGLQESLSSALLQAVEGRCFAQKMLELGVKEGKFGALGLEGLLEEVLVFVRRVAGSACGHPAAEVKGNLDLLALVVKDILASAVEWQSSLDERLLRKSQGEQKAYKDQGSKGAEGAEPRHVVAAGGCWRLVDGRWQSECEGGTCVPIRLQTGLAPHRPLGAGGPESTGEAPCAVCQPLGAVGRAEGPSHSANAQAFDGASIMRFLSKNEWRRVGQTSKALGSRPGPVQAPSRAGSWGPGQGVAGSESSFMDEAIYFVKNTIAGSLHFLDESFNSGEVGSLGDELVRWERSGLPPRHYPDVEVANLEAWLKEFAPQAEELVQHVTGLDAGLSQEQCREAWAALEAELVALRGASCGIGSTAVYEAAGSLEVLVKVLEQHSLQFQGWESALLAWRAAWLGAAALTAWPSRFREQVGRGGSSSSGPSGPC
jgi:hypothetical protein